MKNYIYMVSCLLLVVNAIGQQIPVFNLSSLNPISYNPALAGVGTEVHSAVMSRQWMTAMPGRPVTHMITADGPIGSQPMGWGATLFQDNTGLSSKTGVYGNYAYHLQIDDLQNIHFGVAIGVLQNSISNTDIIAKDVQDPMISNQAYRQSTLDGNFGMVYSRKELELGFGVNQIFDNNINYQVDDNPITYSIQRHYYSTIRYNLYVDREKDFLLSPVITIRAVKNAPMPQDGQLFCTWKDQAVIGIGYRSFYGYNFMAGMKVMNNLQLAYSFDYINSEIGAYGGASHEIALSYNFSILSKEIKKQKKEIDELVLNLESYKDLQNETDVLQTEIIKSQQNQIENNSTAASQNKSKMAEVESQALQTKKELDELTSKLKDAGVIKESMLSEYSEDVQAGYYLVVASVHVDNYREDKMNEEFLSKGYFEVFNTERGWHYIYIDKYDDLESALTELNVIRMGKFKDAWVHIIK